MRGGAEGVAGVAATEGVVATEAVVGIMAAADITMVGWILVEWGLDRPRS
jgi:hypothetical protein